MTDNPRNLPPLKLSIEEDSASFARVTQRTNDLARSIRQAFADSADAGVSRLAQLKRSADSATESIRGMNDALKAQRAELEQQKLDQLRIKDQASGGRGLRVEGFRRTGGALSQLGQGEIGGAVSRVGDLAQIGKEVGSLIEELGPLAPLTVAATGALIGFAAGVKLLDAELASAKRGFDSALDTQKDYYEFEAKATTEQAVTRKRELEEQAVREQKIFNETMNTIQRMEQQFGVSFEVLKKAPGVVGEAAQKLSKQWDANTKAIDDTNAALGRLEGGLQSNAFAANDAAEKEAKLAEIRKSAFQRDLDNQIEIQKLLESGDKKGLEKTKASREAELAIIQRWLEANAEKMAGDEELAKTYEEAEKKAQKLRNEINNLGTAISGIKPDALADFLKGLKKEADRIAKEIDERNSRVAAVQQKYETDVAGIEEKSLQKRAEIEKRYADRQVEIARQAADAAEQALAKLQQQREDLTTSLGRDQQKAERDAQAKVLDVQINAQREEVKAYREHQRELEQIRKDASAREVEFLVRRNFQALYLSRLQTSRDIERSNERFGAGREDRASTAQQQVEDLTRAIARERQERLIAYQQQLADARTAYKRELELAQQKRIQELQLARQQEQAALSEASAAASAELRIRKSAYDQELRLAALYGAARVKVEDQIQRALLQRAEQYLSLQRGTSGGSAAPHVPVGAQLTARAGGGSLLRGQASMVNERGRESFNGVPFPPGLGLFIPAQAGNVSSGRGGGPITLNVYPSPGMDEERLAHKTLDLLEGILGP